MLVSVLSMSFLWKGNYHRIAYSTFEFHNLRPPSRVFKIIIPPDSSDPVKFQSHQSQNPTRCTELDYLYRHKEHQVWEITQRSVRCYSVEALLSIISSIPNFSTLDVSTWEKYWFFANFSGSFTYCMLPICIPQIHTPFLKGINPCPQLWQDFNFQFPPLYTECVLFLENQLQI